MLLASPAPEHRSVAVTLIFRFIDELPAALGQEARDQQIVSRNKPETIARICIYGINVSPKHFNSLQTCNSSNTHWINLKNATTALVHPNKTWAEPINQYSKMQNQSAHFLWNCWRSRYVGWSRAGYRASWLGSAQLELARLNSLPGLFFSSSWLVWLASRLEKTTTSCQSKPPASKMNVWIYVEI